MLTYLTYRSSARRPVRLLICRLDRQRRTVSSTFAGTPCGGSLSGFDSLAVTDGRFDVNE